MLTMVAGAAVLIALPQFASGAPIANGGAFKTAAETASAVKTVHYYGYGYRRYGYRGYGYRGYGYGGGYGYRGYGYGY
jgi:hypothetical protein